MRRARHVVSENARVESFVASMAQDDWTGAGALMTASHLSLRDDYEVSCAELDMAVDVTLAHGAVGARMTGGGFGGCAIALVPDERVPEVSRAVETAYSTKGWGAPSFLTAVPSGGASPQG